MASKSLTCGIPKCVEPVEGALILPYVEGMQYLCGGHIDPHRIVLLAQHEAAIRGEDLVALAFDHERAS